MQREGKRKKGSKKRRRAEIHNTFWHSPRERQHGTSVVLTKIIGAVKRGKKKRGGEEEGGKRKPMARGTEQSFEPSCA